MNEAEWVEYIADRLRGDFSKKRLQVDTRRQLAYEYEIASYGDLPNSKAKTYQTDLIVGEMLSDGEWVPRVVIEAKINSITTHDAITYTRKADSHKTVHPYLRYGVIIGNSGTSALPGRLYRHGVGLISWCHLKDST